MSLRRIATFLALFPIGIAFAACGEAETQPAARPCQQSAFQLNQAIALIPDGDSNNVAKFQQRRAFNTFVEELGKGYKDCPGEVQVTLGFCDGTDYQYVRLTRSSGDQQDYFYQSGTLQSVKALTTDGASDSCTEAQYGDALPCQTSAQTVSFCSSALP